MREDPGQQALVRNSLVIIYRSSPSWPLASDLVSKHRTSPVRKSATYALSKLTQRIE